MGKSVSLLEGIVLLAWVISSACGHPQCLDFQAPFKPAGSLIFCEEYKDLGCCGVKEAFRLKEEYDHIQTKVSQSDWDTCQDYIRDALCQKCSPYAAHIFDAEDAGRLGQATPRYFPGLCEGYCETFHEKCRQIVWFLDPKLAALTVFGSKRRFCRKAGLDDTDYCYPDVLTNFDSLVPDDDDDDDVEDNTSRSDNKVSSAPGCLCLEPVKKYLANPLFARPAYDGSGRVFVAEQVGRVHIYDARKDEWKGIFLDFTKKAHVTMFPGDERGFLGMAFHPQFDTNGRFFIFYSMKLEKGDVIPPELKAYESGVKSKVRVSEMRVKANNPDEADTSSEKVLLGLMQPFSNHNGGEIFFGEDQYLYTFHGDGGAAGDPMNAGQNKSTLYGKVLRLDVDSNPSQPYSIPPDNPFVGEANSRPEIYAYGVRNIWRCGIDRGDRETGDSKGILCGDVGQSKYEEIDLLKKGANYGWNSREGFECYNNDICGSIGPEELPVWAYGHSVGKSVTGGVFYRGCRYPALDGLYIYGDYQSKRLFSLNETDGDWVNKDVSLCGKDLCQGNLVNEVPGKILSFGEDEDGEIYILTSPRAFSHVRTGSMLRIVDPLTRSDPSECGADDERKRTPLPRRSNVINAAKGNVNVSGKKTLTLPSISLTVRVTKKRRPKWNRRRRRRRRLSKLCKLSHHRHKKRCRQHIASTSSRRRSRIDRKNKRGERLRHNHKN